ncbi:MAG: hypothetical protein H6R17_1666 [Proteobacteria bacterium]|nr:hypothetical protein [Pseudomonadota bacterium]
MNPITASYLLAHAFELRLLLALIIVPATYATIQIALLIGRTADQLITKLSSVGIHNVPAAYSAAGAR